MSKEMDKFLAEMNKKFGEENSLKEFGEYTAAVDAIPTGIPTLDYEIGVGGFPRGRIVEIYGPEGAGKTTVALRIMAEAQKLAGQMPRLTYDPKDQEIKEITGRVGMLDVEHAFTPSLADIQGLQRGEGSGFYFDQPTGGDEAMDKLKMMVESNLFDVIVVDSVAGLTTLAERESDAGDKVIAGTASLMSAELKKLNSIVNKTRTIVIFINQVREKPAVQFGSPETTPGGRALKFYSSLRIRVSRGEAINEGQNNPIGHKVIFNIKKNKVAPPFKKTVVDLYYRDSETKGKKAGYDLEADFLQLAVETGVVDKNSSSYSYTDENGEMHKAQGMVKFAAKVQEKGLYGQIINEVMGVQ